MWVTKLLISPVKKRIFCTKTTKFLSIAGSFGALLVGWLVVVARGLYLARHLFTLSCRLFVSEEKINSVHFSLNFNMYFLCVFVLCVFL